MFLTPSELVDLTGLRQKSKQVEWLQDRQYLFEVTVSGHPRVLRAYAETRLGLRRSPPQQQTAPQTVPNFA